MSTQISASTSLDTNTPADAGSSIRAIKRKLDNAFSILDDAVRSPESPESPPPAKKPFTARSLYSTLAKYGIKSKTKEPSSTLKGSDKLPGVSKPTPHLTAILNRAATRTRKALPSFKFPSSASTVPITSFQPGVEYRPSSTPSFLSRLSTFKLATYANKPTAIDAVAAAKCGWVNDGKDRLVCGICGVSWVVAGRDGMTRDAANALLEKQRQSLVQMHKDGCPWKARQCDDSIYRIQLKPPAVMAQDLKSRAIALDVALEDVEIKHPLTPAQVNSLRSTISSITLPPPLSELSIHRSDETKLTTSPPLPQEPSETSILTALFGWSVAPPSDPVRPRPTSISRAVSRLSSRSSTPSISRAASVQPSRAPTPNPNSTSSPLASPAKSPPISAAGVQPRPRVTSRSSTVRSSASDKASKRDASLLHCALCQRRVGLWAFAPVAPVVATSEPVSTPANGDAAIATNLDSANNGATEERNNPAPTPSSLNISSSPRRQFDLLKEHRSYCPYVVKSTIVPALPVLPPSSGSSTNGTSAAGGFNFSVYSLSSQALTAAGVNNAMEGWRAVLTVVIRYGLSQRQRKFGRTPTSASVGDSNISNSANTDESTVMEVDGVEAMVEGVKRRGGRELLRYVKGLLG